MRKSGKPTFQASAEEIVNSALANVDMGWTLQDNAGSRLRVPVKRVQSQKGDPPDKQDRATQTLVGHAEVLCGSVDGKKKPMGRSEEVQMSSAGAVLRGL